MGTSQFDRSRASGAGSKGLDDCSNGFSALRHAINKSGSGSYQRFLQQLRPRYGRVWADIAIGYLGLAIGVGGVCMLRSSGVATQIAGAVLGAGWIGYWMAYLQLFIHEAAHYNIFPTRRGNDILCNVVVSSWTAAYIKHYREVHFGHHRLLGTPDDTENSYFNGLSPRFLLELLFGVHTLRILRHRSKLQPAATATRPTLLAKLPTLASLALHGVLIVALLVAGQLYAAAAWIVGMGMVFPFLAGLRQILEHRDGSAAAATDFRTVPHGAVTRIFSGGLLAGTFGGAGFARHLLHHWEPRVSYTRLGELEAFLATTQAGAIIKSRRTTYLSTLRQLLAAPRRAI
jgi:fatty acid desaturase